MPHTYMCLSRCYYSLWEIKKDSLEVCHPRCVCENWKRYVVKHNYVN